MKSPPQQFTDDEARERTMRFIAGDDETRGSAERDDHLLPRPPCRPRPGRHDPVRAHAGRDARRGRTTRRPSASRERFASENDRGRAIRARSSARRETAEPIAARLGLPVRDLRGASTRSISAPGPGSTLRRARRSDPRWAAWNSARASAAPPGGETMLRGAGPHRRASMEQLARPHPDGRSSLVSHCDVIKAALCSIISACRSTPMRRFEIDPASISDARRRRLGREGRCA